ncbi:C-type lectin domain family 10 member A-like isoform X2 [Apodemus sylvaticus]|uniref:C-type lectin domain family 10 member A-like isoform X2 n=1 Tax=Apodemus sylvaticus TaxID=10129 RepID=UPI002242C03B|nr:C-type lectin domain family 10 member A-like isoform X2 [Apodemus sylvaticus]
MTMIYENFQNLESEEKNQEMRKGDRKGGTESPKFALTAPPQCSLWNILSWTHLLLFSLGLSLLLLVVVSVIGSQNAQLRRDLGTLRATLDNTTSKIKADVQALDSRGDSLQEGISSLKVEVEDHRQELQAGRGLSQKVTSLESAVEKREEALKTDLSEITDSMKQLKKDLKALTCQLASLKNNGSEMACCPLHWTKHEGSCYWFSQSEKSWPEADKYCQLENSHLVVVNSQEEQKFIEEHKGPVPTWMGLTDQNGPWRWVDGTDFDTGFKNWKPQQPDNWHGHGLGGGEDCAHFSYDDGRWNDDVCQRPYRWVCEIELGKAS